MTPAVHAAASGAAGRWRQDAAAAPAIRELVALAVRTDGVGALSGHVLDALDLGAASWLPADDLPSDDLPSDDPPPGNLPPDDQSPVDVPPVDVPLPVTAVAVAVGGDPAEVVVAPRFRGRGLGTGLVTAAVRRQAAVWAYGDLPAAARMAGRLGLVRTRVLLQLRRSRSAGTDPEPAGPAVELPVGITLRAFVPGQDEEAFLAVNARAFAWHPEQGRLDLTGLRADMAQPWFDPEGFFLAVRNGVVVGFHWTKVHPVDPTPGVAAPEAGAGPPTGPVGEVYVIGVDPDAGIRGLGSPLTAAGLVHLRRRGIGTVMLYVEGDNDKALRLYERYGFVTHLTNVVYARPAASTA